MIDRCPKCQGRNIELIQDEVDIGVGIQTSIHNLFCRECGYVRRCSGCGGWEGNAD